MKQDTRYEAWSTGCEESSLYTEDRVLAKMIRSACGITGATYTYPDGRRGWQFRMETKLIPILIQKHRQNHTLKQKDLQAPNLTKSHQATSLTSPCALGEGAIFFNRRDVTRLTQRPVEMHVR
jgi:hypothetical protein